jgi:hypothetical protein
VVRRGGLLLSLCRPFGPRESAEWRDLGLLFTNFELLEVDDVGYWLLTRDQNYSAKSLYSSCLIQG